MKMSIRVKVDIDAIKIARKKGLDQNGAAQRFFTHEVRRLSDPYVPKRGRAQGNRSRRYR